jgi:hypothetical protein
VNAPTNPNVPNTLSAEHRGWQLQVRWLNSLASASGGWVCYATRPAASQGLNIGRWDSSELALEHGRAYIDRQVEAPAPVRRKPNILKRR